MINDIILRIITLFHILLVLFVVGIPFTSSNYFLMLHAIFVPFMMLHWVLNDNTCVLTIIEKWVRKKNGRKLNNNEDCFTCRLIEPIYDFNKNYAKFSKVIYLVTFSLWLLSVGKLVVKYRRGDIGGVRDLFII